MIYAAGMNIFIYVYLKQSGVIAIYTVFNLSNEHTSEFIYIF